MFKCICNLKCDWLRLNGVNVFVSCLCMYRMTTRVKRNNSFLVGKERESGVLSRFRLQKRADFACCLLMG